MVDGNDNSYCSVYFKLNFSGIATFRLIRALPLKDADYKKLDKHNLVHF